MLLKPSCISQKLSQRRRISALSLIVSTMLLVAACNPRESQVLLPTIEDLPTLLAPSFTWTLENTPTSTASPETPTVVPLTATRAMTAGAVASTRAALRTQTLTPSASPTQEMVATPTIALITRYINSCVGANLRTCPAANGSCPILRTLSHQTSIQVSDIENGWYPVLLPDENFAYIAEFLTSRDLPPVCATAAPVSTRSSVTSIPGMTITVPRVIVPTDSAPTDTVPTDRPPTLTPEPNPSHAPIDFPVEATEEVQP